MSKDKQPTIGTYIQEKLKLMREEFCMRLTASEIKHMQHLKTELEVDNYAHDLFMKYL